MKLPIVTQKLIILALTLLAFFWRVYRLDVQSYWIDETWTLYFTNLSPALLWELLRTVEIKPALYYFAAKYWIELTGNGEFALRFFSAIFGVLAVPLTYRLGKALGDARLGLITALLITFNPYQIWHSQDARLYSIFTAASVLSMWGFVNCWRRSSRRWWLVYIAGTLWALYTHFHGFLLIGIQGLFLLLTWRRHRRGYLKWGASLAVIFLFYLPTLIASAEILQTFTNWIEQPTLPEAFVRSAVAYSVGEIVPRSAALLFALAFCVVYGLGLVYAARRRWGIWRGPDMLALLLAYT
ncbi:MAG: glycosyltransferase family 39 protein, partial [Anaerolineae bacterium]|nr:glycosyltransferase family 39 protein [Anaerolineae bacterium]